MAEEAETGQGNDGNSYSGKALIHRNDPIKSRLARARQDQVEIGAQDGGGEGTYQKRSERPSRTLFRRSIMFYHLDRSLR